MRHILETRAPEDRTLGLNDKILALREARLVLGVVHSGYMVLEISRRRKSF